MVPYSDNHQPGKGQFPECFGNPIGPGSLDELVAHNGTDDTQNEHVVVPDGYIDQEGDGYYADSNDHCNYDFLLA